MQIDEVKEFRFATAEVADVTNCRCSSAAWGIA